MNNVNWKQVFIVIFNIVTAIIPFVPYLKAKCKKCGSSETEITTAQVEV